MTGFLLFGLRAGAATNLTPIRVRGTSGGKRKVEPGWLCTLSRIGSGNSTLAITGINRDTDCITYRCFLPDLTRFATVCYAAADQQGWNTLAQPSRGNSVPHKADFGKRAPLAPHLAQPGTDYRDGGYRFQEQTLLVHKKRWQNSNQD